MYTECQMKTSSQSFAQEGERIKHGTCQTPPVWTMQNAGRTLQCPTTARVSTHQQGHSTILGMTPDELQHSVRSSTAALRFTIHTQQIKQFPLQTDSAKGVLLESRIIGCSFTDLLRTHQPAHKLPALAALPLVAAHVCHASASLH